MNVFQKITLQGVKNSKTRTIVTIIGIILSVAMITGVATIISSFQAFMLQAEREADGDWHVRFNGMSAELRDKVKNDERVSRAAVKQNIGYSQLLNAAYDNKRYLTISGFSKELFDTYTINMVSGRLPENSSEIIVPNHIETSDNSIYEEGKTLKLELGDRIFEGAPLEPEESYIRDVDDSIDGSEKFVPTGETKEFKIVGTYERASIEGYNSAGYLLITRISEEEIAEAQNFIVFANMHKPKEVYEFIDDFVEEIKDERPPEFNYEANSSYLQMQGVSGNDSYNTVMYGLGTILILIIMAGSILLIYNAFSISVSERVRQFGILSSVGATKKQLRKSVLFEGFLVGIVGIPIGILVGIGGIAVTLQFISDMFRTISTTNATIGLHVSWMVVVIATVVGAFTIYISAYIPARKAAKRPAIESIKQNDFIKINPKKVKTSKLVSKLFGLEGTIALKNLKRNKKRYRSTVISLFVSIVLFVTVSSFGMFLSESVNISMGDTRYDLMYTSTNMSSDEAAQIYEKMSAVSGVTNSGWTTSLYFSAFLPTENLNVDFIEHIEKIGLVEENGTIEMPVLLHVLDDDSFRTFLKEQKLEPDSFFDKDSHDVLAIQRVQDYDYDNRRFVRLQIFNNDESRTIDMVSPEEEIDGVTAQENIRDNENQSGQSITVNTFVEDIPFGAPYAFGAQLNIFIPRALEDIYIGNLTSPDEDYADEHLSISEPTVILNFASDDPYKSADEMKKILRDANLPTEKLENIAEFRDNNQMFVKVLGVFSYGFIILISLITIANVFNTISTNIHLRRREFAMLKSVGMTDKGMKKMLNLECIFYGLKALLYGLPTSAILSYVIYLILMNGVDLDFRLPWLAIGISIVSVFIVVFTTMLYSIRKIKKENIITALVNDN